MAVGVGVGDVMAEFSYYLLQSLREQPRVRTNWAVDLELIMQRINAIETFLGQPLSSWYGTDPVTNTFYGVPAVSMFAHPRIVTPGGPYQWYLRDRIDQLRAIGNVAPFPWRYTPSLAEYINKSRKCGLDTRQLLEMLQAIGRLAIIGAESVRHNTFEYLSVDGSVLTEGVNYDRHETNDYRDGVTQEYNITKDITRTAIYNGRYDSRRTSHISGDLPFTDPSFPDEWYLDIDYADDYNEVLDEGASHLDVRYDNDSSVETVFMKANVAALDEPSGEFEMDRIEAEAPHLLIYASVPGGMGSGGSYLINADSKRGRSSNLVITPNISKSIYTHRPTYTSGHWVFETRDPNGLMYVYHEMDWTAYYRPSTPTYIEQSVDRKRRDYPMELTETLQEWDLVQSSALPATLDEFENGGTPIPPAMTPTERYVWMRPTVSLTSRRGGMTFSDEAQAELDTLLETLDDYINEWESAYTNADWAEGIERTTGIDGDAIKTTPQDVDYPAAWSYFAGGQLTAIGVRTDNILMDTFHGLVRPDVGKTWLCWAEPYIPDNWPDTLTA